MYIANQLGDNKLVMQSDRLEMIGILKQGGFTVMATSSIVEDICIQATSFAKVELIYCPREANYIAHSLTKECDTKPNSWFEDPPGFMISLLIHDVSVIRSIKDRSRVLYLP
jgi:hypothetical protein